MKKKGFLVKLFSFKNMPLELIKHYWASTENHTLDNLLEERLILD